MNIFVLFLSFLWLVKAMQRGPRGVATWAVRKALYGQVRRVR